MKLNVTAPINGYDGEPVKDKDGNVIVLRALIIEALNAPRQAPKTAEAKAKSYRLSNHVWSDKEIDITVDDAAFIKEQAGETLTDLAYGKVCDALEGSYDDSTTAQ